MRLLTSGRVLRLALGLLVSAVALIVIARHVSLRDVLSHLGDISPRWVLALLLVKGCVLSLKAFRWRGVLAAALGRRPRGAFGAVAAGYLANLLLPLRVGELVRIGALRQRDPEAPLGTTAATVAAERLLDGLVLGLLVSVVLPFTPAPAWLRHGTWVLLAVLLVLLLFALIRPLHDAALRRLPERGAGRPLRWLIHALSTGTSVLRRPPDLARAFLLTVLVWLCEALNLKLAFAALDLPVPYAGALVVTLLFAWGLMLPSGPVQLGTHQALAVLFLEPFGVSPTQAVTASLVLQSASLLVLGSFGGASLLRLALRPRADAPGRELRKDEEA